MRTFFGVLLGVLLIAVSPAETPARDFFGGVSPAPVYVMTDFGTLNTDIEGIGVEPLDDGLILAGWNTYIYVHPSVRIGVMGAGGSQTVKGRDDLITRQVKVGLGYMGLSGEYVFSFMKGDVAVGTMLGYGHADIEILQSQAGSPDWDGIWDVYASEPSLPSTFMNIMRSNFFAYQPFLRLKYKLTGWLSLQGSVGYLGAQAGSWKHRGDVDIDGPPDLDFGGLTITLGPHIGF
jgi:hypothetical protein